MATEPRIQYAHTTDHKSIAYWSLGEGEGPPLVVAPTTPFSHAQLEWTMPECRRWYERLAADHLLVRYDGRGTGLSSRDVDDYTLDANVGDLEAVVDKLGLDSFALFAAADSAMPAIVYAAHNPRRVSHLLLWNAWPNRSRISETAQSRAMRALLEQDWEIYTEAVARVLLQEEAAAKRLTSFYRECTSADVLKLIVPAVNAWDATPYLSQIACPALVMHRRGFRGLDVAVARDLAAALPNAEFALLEGDSPVPFLGDMDTVLRTIRRFFGGSDEPDLAADDEGAPITILFTDMEGSTPLTQRLGDDRAQDILREHNAAIREALRGHRGREIKHTGDGIMASFQSARRALECAIAIQRAMDADSIVRVRVGLNSGEPVAEDRDLFGTSVQLAARVCAEAEPGTILVSNVVRELAAGKGFLFSDRGDVVLRGFEDPVRLFELRWQDEG